MHNTLLSELESLHPAPLDAGLVFSGKASGRLIQGYAQPSAYTPALNPHYLFHEGNARLSSPGLKPPASQVGSLPPRP